MLSHVSLDENPYYHALSYTWQDETLGESFENPDHPGQQIPIDPFVFLEGERIAVTPNLWSALWHLRRTARWYLENPGLDGPEFPEDMLFVDEKHCRFKSHIPLWVDYFCIDQLDMNEKLEQVGQIGRVFRQSGCCHVWLGRHFEDLDPVCQLLEDFKLRFKDITKRWMIYNLSESSGIDKWISERAKERRFKSELSSLRSLCSRQYWTRLWIVQELISCKVAQLRIGLRTLDFIMLVLIMNGILGQDSIDSRLELSRDDKILMFVRIGVHRIEYMVLTSCRLGDVLRHFRLQSCLDPRDKIYGLMGIAFSDTDLRLQANYSLTAEEVYKAVAKYEMNKNGSLDLICNEERYMCQCMHSKHLLSSLPSWVTDWTCLAEHKIRRTYVQPTACLGLKAKLNARIDEDVLTCTGLFLGSINCTQQIHLPQQGDELVDRLISFLWNLLLFTVDMDSDQVGVTAKDPVRISTSKLREIYRLFSSGPQRSERLLFKNLSSAISEEEFLAISVRVSELGYSPGYLSIELQALLDMYPEVGVWWRWNIGYLRHSLLFSMDTAGRKSLGIGMCPNCCRSGDMVVLLYGCSWPVAIRPVEVTEEQFEILGPVQIGADLEMDAISDCEERDFSFV
jgi:hypothetical protein